MLQASPPDTLGFLGAGLGCLFQKAAGTPPSYPRCQSWQNQPWAQPESRGRGQSREGRPSQDMDAEKPVTPESWKSPKTGSPAQPAPPRLSPPSPSRTSPAGSASERGGGEGWGGWYQRGGAGAGPSPGRGRQAGSAEPGWSRGPKEAVRSIRRRTRPCGPSGGQECGSLTQPAAPGGHGPLGLGRSPRLGGCWGAAGGLRAPGRQGPGTAPPGGPGGTW